MNIIIEQEHFLPHCACHINLSLEKNKINLIKGVNGVGKSTLASAIKEGHFEAVTLIEQAPLRHFYNRKLLDLKDIFIAANPHHFDLDTFNELWSSFGLEKISGHSLQQLSGGENQSLKLSLGLSIKNTIIIIDEPSQYLDSNRRKNLSNFLDKLIKDHFVIVIEHESQWLEGLSLKTNELVIENKILKVSHD